jgi:hypothetical protein
MLFIVGALGCGADFEIKITEYLEVALQMR